MPNPGPRAIAWPFRNHGGNPAGLFVLPRSGVVLENGYRDFSVDSLAQLVTYRELTKYGMTLNDATAGPP